MHVARLGIRRKEAEFLDGDVFGHIGMVSITCPVYVQLPIIEIRNSRE